MCKNGNMLMKKIDKISNWKNGRKDNIKEKNNGHLDILNHEHCATMYLLCIFLNSIQGLEVGLVIRVEIFQCHQLNGLIEAKYDSPSSHLPHLSYISSHFPLGSPCFGINNCSCWKRISHFLARVLVYCDWTQWQYPALSVSSHGCLYSQQLNRHWIISFPALRSSRSAGFNSLPCLDLLPWCNLSGLTAWF